MHMVAKGTMCPLGCGLPAGRECGSEVGVGRVARLAVATLGAGRSRAYSSADADSGAR